jgi:hypothetical protein
MYLLIKGLFSDKGVCVSEGVAASRSSLSLQRVLLTLKQELAELWNNWDRLGRESMSLNAGCRIGFLLLHSVLVWYRNGIEEVAAE